MTKQLTGRPHRILVVEDDDTRANLCDILELDGYLVSEVSTVAAALEHVAFGDYMAIILDRNLPDGTADELLPKLSVLAPSAARVVVTGHADFDGTIAALRNGAADYILKPINPQSLRNSLSRILQLRDAKHRAAQTDRLAAMGEMVASIGHESRSALQRITGHVELMELKTDGHPELLEDLRAIKSASDSLKRMFEELREFSATIELDIEPCELGELVQSAWDSLHCQSANKNATLEVNVIDDFVRVDPFRMEQVFRNLLENSLAVCPEPAKIKVTALNIMHFGVRAVRIVFHDNGPGFTEHQRENAFKPFFTTRKQGTGLGLAISKRIVELHGGEIEIVASNTPGACIAVTLSCGVCESLASQPIAAIDLAQGGVLAVR